MSNLKLEKSLIKIFCSVYENLCGSYKMISYAIVINLGGNKSEHCSYYK